MDGRYIMSCGHDERPERPSVYVSYGTHDTFSDGSYGPCATHAVMCQECIDSLEARGVVFFTDDRDEEAWLQRARIEMTDHPITLTLTTEDRLALRRFISEHRQETGEELTMEEAAGLLLRDALIGAGVLEVEPEGEE